MNKAELIDEVAKVTSTKKEAGLVVDATIAAIQKTLKKGGTVTLVGFGTFKVSKRKARVGRNPQTGAALKIAAKKVPVFKVENPIQTSTPFRLKAAPYSGTCQQVIPEEASSFL